jgi:hypothetical protein
MTLSVDTSPSAESPEDSARSRAPTFGVRPDGSNSRPDGSNQPRPTAALQLVHESARLATDGSQIQRDGFVQVRVAGAPRDMGLQHGEQLRDEIRGIIDAIHHHVLYGQPGALGWWVRRAVRSLAGMMGTRMPRRYRHELQGIAHAADVPYRDLLLINSFDDVLANLRLLGALFGRLGCSVFAVTAERTASRELVCGRNLDYFVMSAAGEDAWAATNYMKEHLAVVEYAPEGGAGFVSVGWPGFIGAATAMSERGIVVSSLSVPTMANWPLATPATFTYRRIMEEADSLDAGVGMIRRASRTQGNNVLVGSGDEGTAVVVEYTPRRMAVRQPEAGWIAATNHFNHPDMLRHDGRQAFQSSTERFARLGQLCSSDGACTSEAPDFGCFLTDLETRFPDANEYCTVHNPCTVYSTLFAPAQRTMWVRASDRADRTFQEISL